MKGSFSYNKMINTSKITCVYVIENAINNDIYVGSTTNFASRIITHIYAARKRLELDLPLYRSIRKYGIDKFTFRILDECDKKLLLEKEQSWYDYFLSENRIMLNCGRPVKGIAMNDEIKAKIGAKSKGNKHNLGRKVSDETKEKISKAKREAASEKQRIRNRERYYKYKNKFNIDPGCNSEYKHRYKKEDN